MATSQLAVAVAGNESDGVDVGSGDARDDELGRERGKVTPPLLLPGCHERARTSVVDERAAGRSEGQSSTTALGTAANGPRSGSPAALAPRRRATDESRQAGVAQRRTDPAAHGTSAWEHYVEQRHRSTVEDDQ
jgi:hypothetical protein